MAAANPHTTVVINAGAPVARPWLAQVGAVLDGRDIGTVICPEPDVIKFFVHASLPARAERRFKELQGRGDSTTYARVLQDMTDRDERDRSRGIAALKPATDAYDLDTTGLNPDQVFQKALDHIQSRNRP